ncbi:hypothetical protein [Dactylosporangium darangshiense]|uniref:Uncharacterized protein n=1 Tax=Dactylosporangium darangshiense TaxID=579108 RepID=A0ABP8DQF4_9ACTN
MIDHEAALSPLLLHGNPVLLLLMLVAWFCSVLSKTLSRRVAPREENRVGVVNKVLSSGLEALAGLSVNFAAAAG